MKRTTFLLLLALAGFTSCSATLRLSATAPTMDNEGTCAAPELYSAPNGLRRAVHFSWTGPVSGEDSVITTPGGLATISRPVPPGVYFVHGWASGAGGVGCDTALTVTVAAPPWRVAFQ